jgi:RhtB (resistance to homoserine/threonine) family protein
MNPYWSDFLKIALAHFLAAASPGPDFAIVLRHSLRDGRSAGVWTAWGVATAICLHVTYSLLGLGLMLRSSPPVFLAIKLLGAGYLAWIGVQSLRAKPAAPPAELTREPVAQPARPEIALHHWMAWRRGFLTNALNPKVTLFFVAVFATMVRAGTPLPVRLGYGAWISLSTGAWFTLVAFLVARPAMRRRYLRYGHWIDRALGGVFLVFAGLLLFASLR